MHFIIILLLVLGVGLVLVFHNMSKVLLPNILGSLTKTSHLQSQTISTFRRPHLLKPHSDQLSACVFGKDLYTAIAITNDTGIDSSAVKCGASAEVPRAPYQLLYSVLACWFGVAPT